MGGAEGADEGGEVDARRGDKGAIEVIIHPEALHARLRPGGEIGAILGDELRGAVADAIHADPGEDLGAELDCRCPQGLHIGKRADRVVLAFVVAPRGPDGIGDFVEEAEDIIRADRTVAEPAFGRRAIIELQGVVDAEGDGKRAWVLAEVFAGIARTDLRRARVVEVRIGVEGVALRLDGLAAHHREEHRLLLPDLAVEDAVEAMGEFRGAAVADGKSPVIRQLVQTAERAPAEVGREFVGPREADLITGRPFGALLAGEGEEDAEVLFAETSDRDAGGGGVVADEIDGLPNDRSAGRIAFGDRSGDARELRADGLTDIDRELRPADALGLMLDGRTYARDAFAPIGERTGGVPFIDLGFGRQDDRRPGAGIE